MQIGHDEDGKDEEEEESGARTTRKAIDPLMPSSDVVMEHYKTHLPYRNWCKHCVSGRGLQMPRRAQPVLDDALPEVHMDLCYMGDEARPGKTVPMLVAKVKRSGMKLATVLPS